MSSKDLNVPLISLRQLSDQEDAFHHDVDLANPPTKEKKPDPCRLQLHGELFHVFMS